MLNADSPEIQHFIERWHAYDPGEPKRAKQRQRWICLDSSYQPGSWYGVYLADRSTGDLYTIQSYGRPAWWIGPISEAFAHGSVPPQRRGRSPDMDRLAAATGSGYYATTVLPDRSAFWVVWPTWDAFRRGIGWRDSEPTASAYGYADSKGEATRDAWAAGGRWEKEPGRARNYHETHVAGPRGQHYSIASVGSPGWRWVVFPSFAALCEGSTLTEQPTGLAPTRSEAIQAARAAGGSTVTGSGWAREVHRHAGVERRKTKRSSATDSAPIEYVYHQNGHNTSCSEFHCKGTHEPTAYRVVKKTRTKLFIEVESWRRQRLDDPYDVETFVLDRAAIERGEEVYKRDHGFFAASPDTFKRSSWGTPSIPACIEALGLIWPTSEREIRRAYRRLARAHHPDAGGDHAAFIELGRHYEAALRLAVAR